MALNLVTLYSTVKYITVHVAYEPGARPFTGTAPNGVQYWSILKNNCQAVFIGREIEPNIFVPKDTIEMDQIARQDQTSWTTGRIIDLARGIWGIPQTDTSAEFYVLFLNGYYQDRETLNPQVIGISFEGTPVIAIFKDVITSSGYSPTNSAFLEQATLVHEFGHAVGLVNNGVPMVSDHEDVEHVHHCTNNNCVMYWGNEGTNLSTFIKNLGVSGEEIMFCDECLYDARSYRP